MPFTVETRGAKTYARPRNSALFDTRSQTFRSVAIGDKKGARANAGTLLNSRDNDTWWRCGELNPGPSL